MEQELNTMLIDRLGKQAGDLVGMIRKYLKKPLNYLKEEGREVNGPMIGRYLANFYKDGLDYYEI